MSENIQDHLKNGWKLYPDMDLLYTQFRIIINVSREVAEKIPPQKLSSLINSAEKEMNEVIARFNVEVAEVVR